MPAVADLDAELGRIAAMTIDELRSLWRETRGREPPEALTKDLIARAKTGDGRPLPPHLKDQIGRELDRLELLLGQIKAVEAERDALFTPATETEGMPAPQAMLIDLRGIGAEFAAVEWRRSSSSGVGALTMTMAQTRGSPRLYASSARTKASPSIQPQDADGPPRTAGGRDRGLRADAGKRQIVVSSGAGSRPRSILAKSRIVAEL